MKTKLLYVLVSSEADIYMEQAYVSMFSAKRFMPRCRIVLLTDNQTAATFVDVRRKMTRYADEIISVELDERYSAKERSRILKTNARNYVSGDFLFIDSDTVITKPLHDIDGITADMAACWDTHAPFKQNPYYKRCIKDGRLLHWPIEEETYYYNSGVIYVKDNERTRRFYNLWNRNWFEGLKVGISMDQPSFAKTNYMLGHPVRTLDDVWNCELKHGIRYLKDARIVHYLCTNVSKGNDRQVFLLNDAEVLQDIKKSGEIGPQIIETVEDPFKGLATVVHVFSGDDLFFFRTAAFNVLHSLYKTKFFPIVEACLGAAKSCKQYLLAATKLKRR